MKRKSRLSGSVLQYYIDQLYQHYKPMDLNGAHQQDKVYAIKKLNFILKHATRKNIQEANFEELLICSLTLLYYFGMRIKLSRITSKYLFWCSKRNFVKAEAAFQKLMDCLLPEFCETTIKISLKFFSSVSLWPFESFVGQILDVILYFTRGETVLFNLMLTDIHCVLLTDVKSTRHRMRVLYELLNSNNWLINKHKLLPFITRLLDFFAYSIAKGDQKITAYKYLRQGFEVCLRRIFERVDNQYRLTVISTMLNWFSLVNMSDDDVLDFSALLEYVATLYQGRLYKESFHNGLFDYVLSNFVGSPNALYSLVGCRLLQRFLDRQFNIPNLLVPTIYYDFSQVQLKVNHYNKDDKCFINAQRENLHLNILQAMKLHSNHIVNVRALFAVVCCIVLEVPCGLTAAATACLMMAVQDLALNGENISIVSRYWLHAVVVSVMSLICWVHKAPVLYKYVYQIISRRDKEAPQLNPPLMQSYNLSDHHVTWNKSTLFFEDWELRYGLWKQFQDKVSGFNSIVLA